VGVFSVHALCSTAAAPKIKVPFSSLSALPLATARMMCACARVHQNHNSVPQTPSLHPIPFCSCGCWLRFVCSLSPLPPPRPPSTYQFSPDPAVLDHRVKEFEARIQLMRAVGAAAALRWGARPPRLAPGARGAAGAGPASAPALSRGQKRGNTTANNYAAVGGMPANNYAELDYAELLCAGAALGPNALPR
jgi:hypothetical protein